jgi:hydroxymethylglutaryl-CoA synthase
MPKKNSPSEPPSGLLAFGAYVPRRRLQRSAIHSANSWYAPGLRSAAKGEKAIGNWDEDVLTMAVEAGRDCLTGIDRASINNLRLASTTLPNADRLNAGVVKEALVLEDGIQASDATGSQRSATSALLQALLTPQTSLVLASERRLARAASAGEMAFGEAAAGLLVGAGSVIASCIGHYSVTRDFVDHFRATGERFDYEWEARWIRDEGYQKLVGEAIAETLSRNDISAQSITHTAIAIPVRGVAEKLVKQVGIDAATVVDDQMSRIGHTGAAYPIMLLSAALQAAKPNERILLVSFGQGVDVLVFETTDALASITPRLGVAGWLEERREDTNYQRYLFHRGLVETETGMRAENDEKQPGSTLYRQRKSVMGLIGGRCSKTGTVQFPKTDIGVAPNDRTQGTQQDYPLADRSARVVTFTSDSLTFTPDPPAYYGNVDFEGGGRLMSAFTDVEADDVEVGRAMHMMFRIKAIDEKRGFTKYFWKAAPRPKRLPQGDR